VRIRWSTDFPLSRHILLQVSLRIPVTDFEDSVKNFTDISIMISAEENCYKDTVPQLQSVNQSSWRLLDAQRDTSGGMYTVDGLSNTSVRARCVAVRQNHNKNSLMIGEVRVTGNRHGACDAFGVLLALGCQAVPPFSIILRRIKRIAGCVSYWQSNQCAAAVIICLFNC